MDDEFRKQLVDALGVELRTSVRRAFDLGQRVAEQIHEVQATPYKDLEVQKLLLDIADGKTTLRNTAAEHRKNADVILDAIEAGKESDPTGQFAANVRANREAADQIATRGIREDQEIARLIATIG